MRTFEQILKEGTWSKGSDDEGWEAIRKITNLKKWLYGKFGDDYLFDQLDNSIKRIGELMELEETSSYKLSELSEKM